MIYSENCGKEVGWMICEENQGVSRSQNGGELKNNRMFLSSNPTILRVQIAIANRVSQSVQLFIS